METLLTTRTEQNSEEAFRFSRLDVEQSVSGDGETWIDFDSTNSAFSYSFKTELRRGYQTYGVIHVYSKVRKMERKLPMFACSSHVWKGNLANKIDIHCCLQSDMKIMTFFCFALK